jgi:hypothetical protein
MIDPRNTNDIHELFVADPDFTVTVKPAGPDLGGALIRIGFCASGGAYGVNHALLLCADDWRMWKAVVEDGLRAARLRAIDDNDFDHE